MVQRRKRWECFLYVYLKARVRNVQARCFKAWRQLAAASHNRLVANLELKTELVNLAADAKFFASHVMRTLSYDDEDTILDPQDLRKLQSVAFDRTCLTLDGRARQQIQMAESATKAFLKPLRELCSTELKPEEYEELQPHIEKQRAPLLVAASRGSSVQLHKLLDEGHPTTAQDADGATALILASRVPTLAHFECVHRLLEGGVPLKCRVPIVDKSPLVDEAASPRSVGSDDDKTAGLLPARFDTQDALEIAAEYKSPIHTILDIHLRRIGAQHFLKRERRDFRLMK